MKKNNESQAKNYQPPLKYPNTLEDALVVVSNIIARATTKWTLEETKMFLCGVTQIKKLDNRNQEKIQKLYQ